MSESTLKLGDVYEREGQRRLLVRLYSECDAMLLDESGNVDLRDYISSFTGEGWNRLGTAAEIYDL